MVAGKPFGGGGKSQGGNRASTKGQSSNDSNGINGGTSSTNNLAPRFQDQSKQVFDPRRIFAGGLHPEAGPQQLRSHFECYGEIINTVVPRKNGQSRCFGYITFKEVAAADAAIAEKGEHLIMGRKVDVKPAVPETNNKLFVGGLHQDVRDPYLREYFSQFGRVVGAIVMMDKVSGRSRGFGFVCYMPGEEGEAVIERVLSQPHVLYQQDVEVKLAESADQLPAPQPVQRRGNQSGPRAWPGAGPGAQPAGPPRANSNANANARASATATKCPPNALAAAFEELLHLHSQVAASSSGATKTEIVTKDGGDVESSAATAEDVMAPTLPLKSKKKRRGNKGKGTGQPEQPDQQQIPTTSTAAKPLVQPITLEDTQSGSGSGPATTTNATKTMSPTTTSSLMKSPTWSPSEASTMTPATTSSTPDTARLPLSLFGSGPATKKTLSFMSVAQLEEATVVSQGLAQSSTTITAADDAVVAPTPSAAAFPAYIPYKKEAQTTEAKGRKTNRQGPPGQFFPPGLASSSVPTTTPKDETKMPMTMPPPSAWWQTPMPTWQTSMAWPTPMEWIWPGSMAAAAWPAMPPATWPTMATMRTTMEMPMQMPLPKAPRTPATATKPATPGPMLLGSEKGCTPYFDEFLQKGPTNEKAPRAAPRAQQQSQGQ